MLNADLKRRIDELYELVCRAIGPMDARPNLTVKQVARRLGTSPAAVRGHIATGTLAAINVAESAGGTGRTPRYRIRQMDLEAFESRRRMVVHPLPPRPARRRLSKSSMPSLDLCDPTRARR